MSGRFVPDSTIKQRMDAKDQRFMPKRPMLTCSACDFRGDFSESVDHYRHTRHGLIGSNHQPQDLSGFVGACVRCGLDIATYPSSAASLFADRTVCDACLCQRTP
jgi:hypothetical protein